MLEILIYLLGAVIAIIIAKQFIDAVQNEISAHDGDDIEGGNNNR